MNRGDPATDWRGGGAVKMKDRVESYVLEGYVILRACYFASHPVILMYISQGRGDSGQEGEVQTPSLRYQR